MSVNSPKQTKTRKTKMDQNSESLLPLRDTKKAPRRSTRVAQNAAIINATSSTKTPAMEPKPKKLNTTKESTTKTPMKGKTLKKENKNLPKPKLQKTKTPNKRVYLTSRIT